MIVELTTGVTDLSAVKLSDGATDIKTHRVAGRSDLIYKIDGRFHYKSLPAGNWLPIGFLKDITEEQARKVMPRHYPESGVPQKRNDLKRLIDLLQSKQVYTVNPHGEKPECYCTKPFTSKEERKACREKITQWQEAEQRVGNWFLLRKEAEK